MFSLKKLISTVLAFSMCISIGNTVFASNAKSFTQNPNIKVINNSKQISDQSIEELVSDVNASLIYDNGTIVPIGFDITIDDIKASTKSKNSVDGNTYRVALRSKVEAGAGDKNNEGVTATIYLALTWTDVTGPENILESIEGNVDVTEGTIKSSSVSYANKGFANTTKTTNLGTKTSFSKNINAIIFSPTSTYKVLFENAKWALSVKVSPSIFD